MKKVLTALLLLGCIVLGSVPVRALVTSDLGSYGNLVADLPLSAPVSFSVYDWFGNLTTSALVDFAVLYNPATAVTNYFYQVTNLGGGTNDALYRFTITNPFHFTVIKKGSRSDGLDPVTFDISSPNYFGVNFNTAGNHLAVGETTNRFYFQFGENSKPGIVSGQMIDGGVGMGPVVGPVPEPSTLGMLGLGLLGVTFLRRRGLF